MSETSDDLRSIADEETETIIRSAHNKLRGRLCGFIEACGLPDRQERGAIATLKSISYDIENELVDQLSE